MERESDRFIASVSGGEQDLWTEVYLIVPDEAPRTFSIGWRYLASAVVIAAVAAAVLITSLGVGGRRSRLSSATLTAALRSPYATRASSSASASAAACVGAPGYGGLGARLSAFDPNNNNSTGPAGPSPGAAFYTVTAIAGGCVTAFAVQDSTTPALTARDLLILVSHPYLPADAKPVANTRNCEVWKSSILRRATGRPYARATAIAQAGSVPGTAQIEARSTPTC